MYLTKHSQNVLFSCSQFCYSANSIYGVNDASCSFPAPLCTN